MKQPDAILKQMPVPVAMFKGPDHVYEFANRLHDEVMGRSNVIGKSFREVYPELVGTPILDAFDHVYRTGEPFSADEFSLPLVRGGKKKEAIFKFSIEPLRNDAGVTEGLLTVGIEVTDQVLARWDLGAALNAEKRTETLRERLLGIVGHDLRNPLSTITVSAHMMLKQESLTPQQTKIARRILNSAERMARMIAEILDFAQGRLGGGIPITRALVNLHDVATQSADELGAVYPDRTIELSLEGDAKGHWDADRMSQVTVNLVLNAMQHATPGTPVQLAVRADGDDVVIDVTHTGPAIAAEILPYIWDPFLRANDGQNAARPLRGLGLALYIVEQIVRAHGGTVNVQSGEETTTFTARLPRTEPGV
ncbi:PAS domain-containing sensor histidine kinase [Pendulispora brunnea]|uniref:histidine kinase n=1 Tax=Pendulispora brunnea TaxID=2905690 RepID=A0ABZ2K560_9BACT